MENWGKNAPLHSFEKLAVPYSMVAFCPDSVRILSGLAGFCPAAVRECPLLALLSGNDNSAPLSRSISKRWVIKFHFLLCRARLEVTQFILARRASKGPSANSHLRDCRMGFNPSPIIPRDRLSTCRIHPSSSGLLMGPIPGALYFLPYNTRETPRATTCRIGIGCKPNRQKHLRLSSSTALSNAFFCGFLL